MIGEVIANRYRIVAPIGGGGGGDVFEAEDLELPRRVAIKLLSTVWTDQGHLRQRFLREAEALSSLDHPHICTIYETGETDSGRLFIAMAYYDGQDLRARLAHGALEVGEAVSWGISIADGMDKAHRKGFLHRDLKPGNIVITEDGVVKILDFGLAKLPDRTQMTETGAAMGTLAYAAPEQARGEKADARSDIYSLGVILYQMVTGICPFAATGAAATLQMVFEAKVTPPREMRPDLPRELDTLIQRCMDRNPDRRPRDMAEVRTRLLDILAAISPSQAALHRAQHVDTTATPATPGRRDTRRWLLVALVALATATVALQSGAIREALTGGSRDPNPGAVVVPFRTEGNEVHLRRIATGLWADLSDQAMRLADLSPDRWVLPPSVAIEAEDDSAVEAFGVERMILGAVSVGADHYDLELTAIAADGRRVIASAAWSIPSGEGASPPFLDWLAEVLEIDLSKDQRELVGHGVPANWEAHKAYLEGLGAFWLEADTLAVERLQVAANADPAYALARLRLAEAMIARSATDTATIWLDRADSLLAAEPRPLRFPGTTYELMGRVAESRNDRVQAARLLKLALEHRPSNPDYRRTLWYQWFHLGDPDAADAVTRAGIRLNPGYYGAYEDQAFVSYWSNRLDEAIDYYERCIALAPGNFNAYNSRGGCLLKLERWDEATEMFQRSFNLRPTNIASSNLGTRYYLRGDYKLAADMFEFAQRYSPDSHIIMGNRAAALRRVPGREEEAKALSARAAVIVEAELAQQPDDQELVSYLASYLTMTEPERAGELARRCSASAPEDLEILYRLAVTLEEVGDRVGALEILGAALARGLSMGQLMNEPLLEDLRTDSRFQLLLNSSR